MNIWKTNNRGGCRPALAGLERLVWTQRLFLGWAVFAMGFVLWSQLFLCLVSDYTGGGPARRVIITDYISRPRPGVWRWVAPAPNGLYLHFPEYLSQKIFWVFKENAVKWGFNVTSRGGATRGKVEEFVSLRICGKICRVIRGMFMMSPYKSRLSHNSYISPSPSPVRGSNILSVSLSNHLNVRGVTFHHGT